MDKHLTLDFSDKRRVLIAGDIHGEYTMLQDKLTQLAFDSTQDVLVLVGDLCDRGLQNEEMLDFIANQSIHRVLGNHDIAPRMYLNDEFSRQLIDENFGGGWFTKLPRENIEGIASLLENAPIALTVKTPGGRTIGVVHADCRRDWNQHITTLDEIWVYDLSLWSRETINGLMAMQASGQTLHPQAADISGIDHVFHGHTPLAMPFTCGNRSWIDTGACFGGDLTVWDIDAFLTHKGK
jgi:serine/threonine protein phosphatase 1